MKKITKLTPEQEAELPAFRQRYLDIACGGGRIDRPALQAAIADAYAVIGKPAPALFIFDSPASCMLALKIFKMPEKAQLWAQLGDQLGDQLGGQLWAQLGAQLRGQLGDHLGAQLWAQLRDQLWAQLGDQLGDQLWDQLWDQLGGQLRGQLRDQLGAQLRAQLWDQLGDQNIFDGNCLWGSQGLFWVAWGRFAASIGVILQPKTATHLDIMELISTQCEWWWPYENFVIASERPTTVRFDDQRRLHRENGPAIEYADGYAVWSWHGVRVPENWIIGKGITPHEALTWENMEQRRAACEILGWDTILDQLKAKTLDKDVDPEIGELIRVRIPDIGDEQFLRVTCGTGRRFALPVPPDMKTALQANSWTYGFDLPTDYQPEVRT